LKSLTAQEYWGHKNPFPTAKFKVILDTNSEVSSVKPLPFSPDLSNLF